MWQSHLSYHPRIAYTYAPNFRGRLPHCGGGYLLRTNASGFRSEREFVRERGEGVFRALLFGDSQTAGLGVGNRQRYGDLLEGLIPRLEIYNYAIDGVGVDQEFLTYNEFGTVDHDLVVVGLYVDDVSRVTSRYLRFADQHGKDVYYAKPYFEIEDRGLTLHHVPAPKRPFTRDTLPEPNEGQAASGIDRLRQAYCALVPDTSLRQKIQSLGLYQLAQSAARIDRAPGYGSPDNPGWLLLSEILKQWVAGSKCPVLLVPIPAWAFVDGTSDPTAYQVRHRELAAAANCLLHDPLPDLQSWPAAERQAFYFAQDRHLSPKGHLAMAQSLQPVIARVMEGLEHGSAPRAPEDIVAARRGCALGG